jgi:hypothetical protein
MGGERLEKQGPPPWLVYSGATHVDVSVMTIW